MALTPEEQNELRFLEQQLISSQQPTLEETGVTDRLSRGVDVLQATGGRAVQAFGEIVGNEELANKAEQFAQRQDLEAELEAPAPRPFDEDAFGFIGDALLEGVPSLGALGASAGAGALAGSVVPGIGTGIGALTGLGLGALGLNLGTAKEIEQAIDPESEADLGTALTAGVATIPDVLLGGVLGSTAKQSMKSATKQAIAKNVLKDSAVGVGGAIATQTALDVGATLSTEAGFDEQRVDTIQDNVANAAVLSSVASPTLSATAAAFGRGARARDEAAQETSPFRVEDDGGVTMVEPNPEAIHSPDALRKGLTSIGLGRPVDELIAIEPNNLTVREFAAELDTTFDERVRRPGRNTVNVEAQLGKGEFSKEAGLLDLNRRTKAERKQIKQDLLDGLDTPETKQLRSAFKGMLIKARKAGIQMGDMGKTYFPFIADTKKIKANRTDFINDMVESADVKDKAKFRVKVNKYIDKVIDEGSPLHLGQQTNIPKELRNLYDDYQESGGSEKARKKLIEQLKKPIRKLEERGKVDKNNSLEQHRALSEVDPKVLEKWSQDLDILEVLDMYGQSASERIAYAERFGANNEKLHGMVRLAQLESLERNQGRPLSIDAVEKMYNLTDLQQRISAKRVTPEYRNNVRAIKTAINVKLLTQAVLSSLIEPLFLAPKTGVKPFVKGGMKAIETSARKLARNMLRTLPASEFENALVGMNTGFREALGTVSARIGEDTINPSKIDQMLFTFNGLAAWTEFTRIWAQASALEHFKQDATKLQDTTLPTGERAKAAQRLGEAGVDPNRVVGWMRRGASQDDPEFRTLQAGAINLAEDVVFNPKPITKPTWMSDPTWYKQLFGQLKSFPITFTNRLAVPVVNRMMQSGVVRGSEQALKTATVAGLATTGFIMQDALKIAVREGNLDKWEDKDAEERIASAVLQLGATSLFADPIASEASGGSAIETVAGPAAGIAGDVVENVAGVIGGNIEPEDFVNEMIADLLPNVPLASQLREDLRD